MAETKKSGDDDAFAGFVIFGVIAVFVITAFLVAVKYAPPVIAGVIFGWCAYITTYRQQWLARVKGVLFVFLTLAVTLFVLFGLPTEVNNGEHFRGVLFDFDWYKRFVAYVIQTWNQNIPDILKLRRMFFIKIDTVSSMTIAGYAWISMGAAAFVFIVFGISRAFGRLKAWPGPAKTAVANFAEYPGHLLFLSVFGGWVVRGRTLAISGPFTTAIGFGAAMVGVGYLAATYLVTKVVTLELSVALTALAYAPGVGAVLGWLLGLSEPGRALVDEIFYAEGSKTKKKGQLESGFTLGTVKNDGGRYVLTERNLGYHIDAVGSTGVGKTTLLKNFITNRMARGYGLIFLDFKADFDTVSWLYRASKATNRADDVRLLSLSHRDLSVPYNPIQYGDRADIHSSLMNAMTWSESYYRSMASQALMTLLSGLCEYRDKTKLYFHLGHVYELLDNPRKLRAFADELGRIGGSSSAKVSELAARIDKKDGKRDIGGLLANLYQLVSSAAGELLTDDVTAGSFNFKEAIEERRIVYMLMNSLKLKESASVSGKLILQDLMHYVGEHYSQIEKKEPQPIALIIDEFASFATPEFIEFMDRARGAGIGIVLAHQSRADLRAISPEFQERVEANANTVIVSGITSTQDAEHYAGLCGTQTTQKETKQLESGLFWDNETGMKSVREVEEYVVHPNQLKDLQQGEFFVHSKIVDPGWGLVRIGQADDFADISSTPLEVSGHLKQMRDFYMKQGRDKYLDLTKLTPNGPKPPNSADQGADAETWE